MIWERPLTNARKALAARAAAKADAAHEHEWKRFRRTLHYEPVANPKMEERRQGFDATREHYLVVLACTMTNCKETRTLDYRVKQRT